MEVKITLGQLFWGAGSFSWINTLPKPYSVAPAYKGLKAFDILLKSTPRVTLEHSLSSSLDTCVRGRHINLLFMIFSFYLFFSFLFSFFLFLCCLAWLFRCCLDLHDLAENCMIANLFRPTPHVDLLCIGKGLEDLVRMLASLQPVLKSFRHRHTEGKSTGRWKLIRIESIIDCSLIECWLHNWNFPF